MDSLIKMMFCVNFAKALCTEERLTNSNIDMQISSETTGGAGGGGGGGVAAPSDDQPCRFPKLEECAHFHYERVQLPKLTVSLQTNIDRSLHTQHSTTSDDDTSDTTWYTIQVESGLEECWLLQRTFENFQMLDSQLHQCIYDRKISQLPNLSTYQPQNPTQTTTHLTHYLHRFSTIADNSVNCGPVLNWLQMDNKGHRLLVPSEESRSINTPAVAAAYSVRRYVSQARDELNLEVGDMISVIDMAQPGESMWWRGKRGFQVGFFPQHCVHIIGDKVPRNMPLPPPVVGSLAALSPIKPVLRKHGKLITFFRSFILNRPSRRRLKQTGILKERVFGCDLGEHLLNSGLDIPMVLKCCAEFIEKCGIVDGIYRLSGVTSNIQKLRNAFDEDRVPNLYTEDILQDIHSVASLLKMYFRELPNPLCTYQLYQSFVNAVQGSSSIRTTTTTTSSTTPHPTEHERLLKMREAVQKLPPPHYRTLEYLMRHLAKVAKHGANTGMTTRNVAIVWAPNLLRCAELEVGGVAALQGVGVQAVVTEFLICYSHLIFCDHLPNLDFPIIDKLTSTTTTSTNPTNPTNLNLTVTTTTSPKKCRPKSLAISTPTKLITLEEARTKHLLLNNTNNKNNDNDDNNDQCNYIEVGGGPKNLPKKYHTIIELPSGGGRKRGGMGKRSPLGWRSLFSKTRNNSQGNLATTVATTTVTKSRKASTPGGGGSGGIAANDKSVTESDLTDMKRKLRSVKSAESLTSGHSEPASTEIDVLGPLYSLNKPPGHNRSVSHDSYFDTLQTNSQNNSENSLLDLSEIQLNFELEESEMRIFSEDESLVSSPRITTNKTENQRRILTRARPEEFSSATNSGNPSPKKQARVVLSSPDAMSRKRTRLEDQLNDIQYIDCTTPDNLQLTNVLIHSEADNDDDQQPQKKSPRNSHNFEYNNKLDIIGTPTPQSPSYRELLPESNSTTPEISPSEIVYDRKLNPNYENILTTISITYKSPPRSIDSSPIKTNFDLITYENVVVNVEKAIVPTSIASLPIQQASQSLNKETIRPKSLSVLETTTTTTTELSDTSDLTLRPNFSSTAICCCDTNNTISSDFSLDGATTTTSSNQSLRSNVEYTLSTSNYQVMDDENNDDDDLSEVVAVINSSSGENLSETESFQMMSNNISNNSPNVSTTTTTRTTPDDLIEFSPNIENTTVDFDQFNLLDKRKSTDGIIDDDTSIYQQVKFFRRSIHEVNALLDLNQDEEEEEDNNYDSLEPEKLHIYENVDGETMNKPNNDEKICVKDLKNKFEAKQQEKYEEQQPKIRKFYEKDSLPPCLRARNLKNQLKTRSLDEDEFKKEFGGENKKNDNLIQRRRSMDETMGYKTNSLPKRLNQPKLLPLDESKLTQIIHLAHSNENIKDINDDEEMKKRERIEKYKEERRKYLQDKYRSESFKEDKDVLLSQLKLFKHKDEKILEECNNFELIRTKTRRKNSGSGNKSQDQDYDNNIDSLEDDNNREIKNNCSKENNGTTCTKIQQFDDTATSINKLSTKTTPINKNDNFKLKTAIFEQSCCNNQRNNTNISNTDLNKMNIKEKFGDNVTMATTTTTTSTTTTDKQTKKVQQKQQQEQKSDDFIRKKLCNNDDDNGKNNDRYERRRHTFERERGERLQESENRVSLDTKSTRLEKSSPSSYCIKDMKAIFESKSKQ